jgi:hypothetical protein
VPIIARKDGRYTVVSHLVQHDLLLIVSRHLCLQPFDRGLKRFGIEIRLPFSVRESLESLGFFHGREIRKIVAHKVVFHVVSKRFAGEFYDWRFCVVNNPLTYQIIHYAKSSSREALTLHR